MTSRVGAANTIRVDRTHRRPARAAIVAASLFALLILIAACDAPVPSAAATADVAAVAQTVAASSPTIGATPTVTATTYAAPVSSPRGAIDSRPDQVSPQDVETAIVDLVNQERTDRDLPALARNAGLDALARQYAESGLSDNVREAGDLAYLLSASWWQTYAGRKPRLTGDSAADQVAYCLSDSTFRAALLRPEAGELGVGVAIVDNTVYYTIALDVLAALGANGELITLYDNPGAADPSWEQLVRFLHSDSTDEQPYELGSFVCTDFAEMLHNNAERAGIRAAVVTLEFPAGPGHALNAFSVGTDIVYVDAIGGDKVAYVEQGRAFGVISLDAADGFSYAYFEEYARRVYQHLDDREAYAASLTAHNAEVRSYNKSVDAYNKSPTEAEYDRLEAWLSALDRRGAELEAWFESLAAREAELSLQDQYWDPTGSLLDIDDATVTRIYVHW